MYILCCRINVYAVYTYDIEDYLCFNAFSVLRLFKMVLFLHQKLFYSFPFKLYVKKKRGRRKAQGHQRCDLPCRLMWQLCF